MHLLLLHVLRLLLHVLHLLLNTRLHLLLDNWRLLQAVLMLDVQLLYTAALRILLLQG